MRSGEFRRPFRIRGSAGIPFKFPQSGQPYSILLGSGGAETPLFVGLPLELPEIELPAFTGPVPRSAG